MQPSFNEDQSAPGVQGPDSFRPDAVVLREGTAPDRVPRGASRGP